MKNKLKKERAKGDEKHTRKNYPALFPVFMNIPAFRLIPMKRAVLFLSVVFLLNACYKDDIDDLNKKYDDLRTEQERQEEELNQYKTLLNAMEQKLTVSSIETTGDGTRIWFSDGSCVDAGNSAAIVSVEELNGQVFFHMSDGSVITIQKKESIALYILSEGGMGQGNSDLSYYDIRTQMLSTKYFSGQNTTPLGDTGNDLKLYGSKMYCVVSGPAMSAGGHIEVIDPKTGLSVKRILATDADGNPDMPRRIALADGKVYVTMYSGSVARIDTTTLEINGRVPLSGSYPEGICTYGGKLYVCNSGQGPGNTISVIDLSGFTETGTIKVPENPSMIEATPKGDIYFTTADYSWANGDVSKLHRFNVSDIENIKTFDIRASKLVIGQEYVYVVETDWTTYGTYFSKVNLKTDEVGDFISDGTSIMLGYNICMDPTNGDIYVSQSMGDWIYCYDSAGKKKIILKTKVVNGSAIAFITR
ncbi:MAG: hypothetical protein LBQ60_11915 [Bacteroidales bacterium]|jgi:DNA-binding beta-propeller fold protein YncE|nr:hypothetical protein [Bacteroidales bacterium]